MKKIEKINKYDPFTDEFDYMFYTNVMNLKEKVDPELLDKKKKSSQEQDPAEKKRKSHINFTFRGRETQEI